MAKKPTRADAYEAIAQSLREFGYGDCTAKMVEETHAAMKQGKTTIDEMPHGVVSAFAQSQLEENAEWIDKLP